MNETLITELIRVCKAEYGIDVNESSGARDLLAAELGMLKCLVAAGRAAMQRWCEQLGTGYVGSRAVRNGVRYRFVGYRQKAVHGLFGAIVVVRAYYAPLGSGGTGWWPVAERVGIGCGYTPGCQYFMARFSAEQPYEESLRQFHEVFRADGRELISMHKAFEMVQHTGGALEQRRQDEIAQRAQQPVAVREPITGTMAVSIDAGKVPVRANERVTDEGAKSYERAWRDSKVATVSAVSLDQEGQAHCTKTSCVSGVEHADEFFARIEVEMSRRSAALGSLRLVVLGDGAAWIWDRVADLGEVAQKVWQILDFWHACDHLSAIAKELYGEGSRQFSACYERWRQMLWDGCVAAVVEELRQVHAGGACTAKQREAIQGHINYFAANQQRMDYPLYRALGLPIGSGTVESACKNVVAARMKQSGMMWSLDGAKNMLQIRASVKSRRFWSDFESLLPHSPPHQIEDSLQEAA